MPLAFILALLLTGTPADRTETEAPREAAEKGRTDADRPDPERMVCKSTPVIGTRFPAKVCKTRQEWDRQSQGGKDTLDEFQRRSLSACATTPCS